MELSLIIPTRQPPPSFQKKIETLIEALKRLHPLEFEIILVPNDARHEQNEATDLCARMSQQLPNVRCVRHVGLPGKGSAVKTGMSSAQGSYIFYLDADVPYGLDFISSALQHLRSGYHLVNANRRHPQSTFTLPVSLLHIAYRRHRLGLIFNKIVRMLFPIQARDTQSGFKALNKELVQKILKYSICPGFYFDIEIFLIAQEHGFRFYSHPVQFFQESEKTTIHLLRESIQAIYWLLRIKWRSMQGAYRPTAHPQTSVPSSQSL